MKMTQLLTGAAAIALVAGAANAQEATIVAAVGDTLEGQTIVPEVTTNLAGDIVIDFEFVSPGADADINTAGDNVAYFGTLGAGGGVVLRITLENATLDGVFSGAINASDDDCDFGAPTLGGGSGGDFIQYESTGGALQACSDGANANDASLTIPVNVTDENLPVNVAVSYTGDGVDDNTFQDSTDDLKALVIGDASLDFTINAGAAGAGLFDEDGDELDGSGVIATLEIADLPDNDIDVANTTLVDVSDLVASAELVVTFPSGAEGIGSVEFDGDGAADGCAPGAAPNDNVFTCSLTAADLDLLVDGAGDAAAARGIIITDDGVNTTFITAQTPTIELNLTGQTGFDVSGADVAATAVREIELDDGVETTAVFADGTGGTEAFEWVSLRATGGTKNAFRMIGLEAEPTEVAVVVENAYARAGATAPAEARAVIADVDVQEDPLNAGRFIATFTSEDLAAALGTDGGVNGDVHFEVTLPDNTGVADIEVRRLLSTSGSVAGTGFDARN